MAITPTQQETAPAVTTTQPDAASGSPLLSFDFPRMSLHDALQRYSSLSGRSVLYDARQVDGRQSSPLIGRFTADNALQILISGSGMQSRFASDEAFMLVPIPARKSALDIQRVSPATYPYFFGQLQDRITRILCADTTLDSGTYRLALRFRVGSAQAIEQLQVHATGRNDLEPQLFKSLNGLALGVSPPAGLRQPILLLIQPHIKNKQECVS